jgi:hypothetical protein
MEEFTIWTEGYSCTGNSSGAMYHGNAQGNTFTEACRNFFRDNKYYNPIENTYWACKCFDNETDAKKSFG